MSSRDERALAKIFDAALEVVDHQNGATYGHAGHLESVARLLRMRDARLGVEPLATLGERLVLWRRRIRAKGNDGVRYDVGELEREEIVLFELNDGDAVERIEVFAANRLSHADGMVLDQRQQPVLDATVVLFPADERLRGYLSRYLRSARPDQEGRFRFSGVPPGEYLTVAVQGLEDGEASDPEFLAAIENAATRLTIDEGETKSVTLGLSTVPR